MARITWDQVGQANFSGSNEQARLAADLLSRAGQPLQAGIEQFQKGIEKSSSNILMQRMQNLQDPAAAAAALADGSAFAGLDPRYLSTDAQMFAAGQASRLLGEDQAAADIINTNARTGLVGAQTETSQYNLGRARVEDGRADERYTALQALEPVQAEIDRLSREGDITGARRLAQENTALFGAADVGMGTVYSGISSQATGGYSDVTAADGFRETVRGNDIRDDSRALVEAAVQEFGSQSAAEKGIRDAIADGSIGAEAGASALAALGQGGFWRTPTELEASLLPYGGGVVTPPTDSGWVPGAARNMAPYREAIASIESAGSGGYAAVGPTDPELGRALGRYQIMEANVGPWSREILGREVSVEEFMANPAIQDAIFDGKFGQYIQEHGEEGAAQAWFSGPGGVGDAGRTDSLGTNNAEYTARFRAALDGGQSLMNPGQPLLPAERSMMEAALAQAETAAQAPATTAAPDPVLDASADLASTAQRAAQAAQEGAGTTPVVEGPELAGEDAPRLTPEEQAAISETPPTVEEDAARVQAQLDQVQAQINAAFEDTAQFENGQGGAYMNNVIQPLSRQREELQAELDLLRSSAEAAGDAPAAVAAAETQPGQTAQEAMVAEQNRPFFQSGGLVSDLGRFAQIGAEGIVNTGAAVVDVAGAPFRAASEYAFGTDVFGRPGRVDFNGDGYGQTIVPGVNNDLGGSAAAAAAQVAQTPAPVGPDGQPLAGSQEGTAPEDVAETSVVPLAPASGPVEAGQLSQAIATLEGQFATDQLSNPAGSFISMIESLPNSNSAGQIANALVADDGPLSGYEQNDIREIILSVMRETGIRDPRAAGALVAEMELRPEAWLGLPFDGISQGYFDGNTRPDVFASQINERLEGYGIRINDDGTLNTKDAVASYVTAQSVGASREALDEVVVEFDRMNALFEEAIKADPSQRAALEQVMEERVYTALWNQLSAITATGDQNRYTGTNTGN